MKIFTSWDDGSIYDLRVAELLCKNGLPGIFYISGNTKLRRKEIKMLHDAGYIIGGHTVHHPEDMKKLSPERQYQEIKINKDWLEEIIGEKVLTFAYPGGRYNETTIEMVKKAGFISARGTGWGDQKNEDPFCFKPHAFVHPDKSKFGGKPWHEFAFEQYVKNLENNESSFHIFGHADDLERFNMWKDLENFFNKIKSYESLHTGN